MIKKNENEVTLMDHIMLSYDQNEITKREQEVLG